MHQMSQAHKSWTDFVRGTKSRRNHILFQGQKHTVAACTQICRAQNQRAQAKNPQIPLQAVFEQKYTRSQMMNSKIASTTKEAPKSAVTPQILLQDVFYQIGARSKRRVNNKQRTRKVQRSQNKS